VLAGGLVAAILGPEVSRYSFDIFPQYIYLGTYLFAALIQIFNIIVLIFVKIEKPKKSTAILRPLITILMQKTLVVAILAAAVG
jgi:hypothetical protein